MNATELLNALNQEPEMNPDLHDGSYELMREIVKSYSTINDYSEIDYKDLNAVYAMVIGTWKLNVERKKEYINNGHLSLIEKRRLSEVIDRVWDNACRSKYENRENNRPSIGMFGTGFYSFERNADDASSQRFIKLLVDIADLNDDNQIYNRADRVFDKAFKGMQAAAASVMLHCLKPCTFPILNSNFGDGTIYEALGIKLNKEGRLITYIDNCRRIKAFRDANMGIRNYRIFDRFPRKIAGSNAPQYIPSLSEYDPGISAAQYRSLIELSVNKEWLDTIYYIYQLGGEATCSTLSKNYGNTSQHYSVNAVNTARQIQKSTQCELSTREQGGDRFWAVLFQGRYTDKEEQGSFSWRLREPLFRAIEELDSEDYFAYFNTEEIDMRGISVSKNTILYGPPGTGKTYYTVIYAVAVIEGKSVEEIKSEASYNYNSVKARYDEYVSAGRIAFTTFHQSYGYEEFIEGIKPNMIEGDDDIGYRVESGVFKKFCDRASIPSAASLSEYGINNDPAVWKVSLGGSHDNPVRTDCMENNHIRIGWDKYGPDISDRIDELTNGKLVLNAFTNIMRKGDIVLSCYSSTEIDGIGVVTGDYRWDDSYNSLKRVRDVKWIVKNIRENILEYNNGYVMAPATVYWIGISASDVLSIIEKHKLEHSSTSNSQDRFVFIIDEINRGNISKVFGELITLVEETKRLGALEQMKVQLPYSHSSFGVPNNVYILGTMNTADRSIAIMDTALRRRFSFVEMLPESEVLRSVGADFVGEGGITLSVADMLDVINERITFLFNREHTIGHAFFTSLKDDPSVENLGKIFEKSIIPLLQEYFYEDYSKIQLILGDDGKSGDDKQYQFIRDEEIDPLNLFSSNVDMESVKKYTIQYSAFNKIQSYKLISKNL